MTDSRGTASAARRRSRPAGRRFGYLVAAAVNGVLLWVAHHLLEWEWPRFLTEDFEQVLPILTWSMAATIAANLVFVVFDPRWFTALAGAVTAALSVAVGVRTWQVFPFDFSTYAVDWTTVARVVIAVGIVGSAVAALANLARFVGALADGPGGRGPEGDVDLE